MKFNFISLVNPYRKMITGGSEDIRRRIEALANEYEVCVLAMDNNKEQIPFKKVPANITLKTYTRQISSNLFSWIHPIPVITRYNRHLVHDISRKLEKHQGQIIIIEGLQSCICWNYIPQNLRLSHYSILRLHNIESNYHREFANSVDGFLPQLIHKFVSWQYTFFEPKNFRMFDEIHVISLQEIKKLRILYPDIAEKFKWVPPLVNVKENFQVQKNDITINFKIGYFGDLSIPLNSEGVRWFIKSIWPIVKNKIKNAQLHIAGHHSEAFQKFSDDFYVHGFVDDLTNFINDLDVLIVPIKNGAGVKIKVIDSIAWGKPLVTTSVGIEGTDERLQELVWVRDSEAEFGNSLINIYNDYLNAWEKAQEAKEWITKNYNHKTYCDICSNSSIEFKRRR